MGGAVPMVREGVLEKPTSTPSLDCTFQQKVPGQFVFLGVTLRDQDHTTVARNHSPLFFFFFFFADESALPLGVRLMTNLALRLPPSVRRSGSDQKSWRYSPYR